MFRDFRKFGVIPLVRAETEEDAMNVAKALAAGGLPAMELAFRSFAHSKAIRSIAKEMPDFLIGAGNILNKEQLLRAIDSHAKFAFSPGVNVDTIKEASKKTIVFAPGVCSPTDIETALLGGAADFQFFPAEPAGGVPMLKMMLEPFQHLGIEIFAKGGIGPEKVADYLKVPHVAAVSSAWIAPQDVIQRKEWGRISEEAAKAVSLVVKARAAS